MRNAVLDHMSQETWVQEERSTRSPPRVFGVQHPEEPSYVTPRRMTARPHLRWLWVWYFSASSGQNVANASLSVKKDVARLCLISTGAGDRMPFLRRSESKRLSPRNGSNRLEPLGERAAPSSKTEAISALEALASAEDVERLFSAFYHQPLTDQSFAELKSQSGVKIIDVIEELIHSPEIWTRLYESKTMSGSDFRIPKVLSGKVLKPSKVLLIGSCAMDIFFNQIAERERETQFEKITFNNGSVLPPLDNERAAEIDFQVIQLPIRAIMPEHMYLNGHISEQNAFSSFESSRSLLQMNLEAVLLYARRYNILTFVMNFLTPQQNPMGRLQKPFGYDNPVFYINELNRELYNSTQSYRGVHYVDAEQISAVLGKRFIQDDSVTHLNHGSTMSNIGMDVEARIEPVGDVPALYSARVGDFNEAIYDEILSSFRSLKQHGAIKLVIFDLDDTLWRGVAAERLDDLDIQMTEGWPLGLLEAASFLHKRGIMLSIVSKNDEDNVIKTWTSLYENRFSLSNFVGRQVNWEPKVNNIIKILQLTNVGADATLFVDDNPAERERVRRGVPGIRLLEGSLAEWRRQLLWSAELQPPVITAESLGRSASIQAKMERDDRGQQLSREEFLEQLDLKVTPIVVENRVVPSFSRCLELINKTNQFNTTGRRWTEVEAERLFQGGGWFLAVSVADQYADYGITAIAICQGAEVVQFVMSCRVFGLGVEEAALAFVASRLRATGSDEIDGRIAVTDRNALSVGFYQRLGFEDLGGGLWRLPSGSNLSPSIHVKVIEPVG